MMDDALTITAPPEIVIEGLEKAFGANQVLTGVNLEIRRGDFLAIVGASGCGKTVLMNHILGQLVPDAGRVRVADHGQPGAPLVDLAELDGPDLDRIHAQWGVVFQRNALFSGSVLDNIALWLREVRNLEDDEITELAKRSLVSVHLPADDEFLATSVEELSGGMAKRLAVARALSMDPKVIYYDEPTTGLDPTSAAQIQDLVLATHFARAESGGEPTTTVVITHDKDLLKRLHPRTVMLHEGKVFFDGPFAEFEAADSSTIRPYFELMPTLNQRTYDTVSG